MEEIRAQITSLQAPFNELIEAHKITEELTDRLRAGETVLSDLTKAYLHFGDLQGALQKQLQDVLNKFNERLSELRQLGIQVDGTLIESESFLKIEPPFEQPKNLLKAIEYVEVAQDLHEQLLTTIQDSRDELNKFVNYLITYEVPLGKLIEYILYEFDLNIEIYHRKPLETVSNLRQLQRYCFGLLRYYIVPEFQEKLAALEHQTQIHLKLGGEMQFDLDAHKKLWHDIVTDKSNRYVNLESIYDALLVSWYTGSDLALIRNVYFQEEWDASFQIPILQVDSQNELLELDASRIYLNEQLRMLRATSDHVLTYFNYNNKLRQNLLHELEDLCQQAAHLRNETHSSFSEFEALDKYSNISQTISSQQELLSRETPNGKLSEEDFENQLKVDEALRDIVPEFRALIEYCQLLGGDLVEKYVETMNSDTEYLFSQESEVKQLAKALLSVCVQASYYEQKLWVICEDFLLRLEYSGFDTMSFYNEYGFELIEKSVAEAFNNERLLYVLDFLTKFLPPSIPEESEYSSSEAFLLNNPKVKKAFHDGFKHFNVLLPQRLEGINLNSIIIILKHANLLNMPKLLRIQWAATLHKIVIEDEDAASTLGVQTTQLYLQQLSDVGLNIGFYYNLLYFGEDYPEIWSSDFLIDSLTKVLKELVERKDESRVSIINFCSNEQIRTVMNKRPETGFALAMLTHYGGINWNNSDLKRQAWWYWSKVSWDIVNNGQTFIDMAKSQINGDLIAYASLAQIEESFVNTIKLEIEPHLTPPSYAGKRIAMLIHAWYVEEHIREYLDKLKKDISLKDLAKLREDIATWLEIADFVAECPLQKKPPQPHYSLWDPSPLKDAVNNNLFELFNTMLKAVQIRETSIEYRTAKRIRVEPLREEIRQLRLRDKLMDWACGNIVVNFAPPTAIIE